MEGNWRGKRGGYSNYNPRQYQSENKSFERSQKQGRGSCQKPKTAAYFKREGIPKWLLDMPYWDKCFVLEATSRWWKHFLDCQRGLDLYKNVFNWDDSAGAEAFHNAKIRFWAEMKSLPCDVPLPDPQMFIDDLDWDTIIDPEVCRDLEKAREPPEEEEDELKTKFVDGVIYYRGHPTNPSGWDDYKVIEPTGWDAEDSPPDPLSSLMKPIIYSSSVYSNEEPVYGLSPNTFLLEGGTKTSNTSNSWEDEPWGQKNLMKKKTSNSWEDDSGHLEKVQPGQKISWEDNRGGWQEIPSGQRDMRKNTMSNSWENNNEAWETVRFSRSNTTNEYQDQGYSRNNGNWNKNENWRKKESQDQNLSRYKKTGYRPVLHQTNYESKITRGKKSVSFAQEQAHGEPLAQRHWNSINP